MQQKSGTECLEQKKISSEFRWTGAVDAGVEDVVAVEGGEDVVAVEGGVEEEGPVLIADAVEDAVNI